MIYGTGLEQFYPEFSTDGSGGAGTIEVVGQRDISQLVAEAFANEILRQQLAQQEAMARGDTIVITGQQEDEYNPYAGGNLFPAITPAEFVITGTRPPLDIEDISDLVTPPPVPPTVPPEILITATRPPDEFPVVPPVFPPVIPPVAPPTRPPEPPPPQPPTPPVPPVVPPAPPVVPPVPPVIPPQPPVVPPVTPPQTDMIRYGGLNFFETPIQSGFYSERGFEPGYLPFGPEYPTFRSGVSGYTPMVPTGFEFGVPEVFAPRVVFQPGVFDPGIIGPDGSWRPTPTPAQVEFDQSQIITEDTEG